MLIGLAVVPQLGRTSAGAAMGGVEAVLFYLIAYGAMTVGAFAVLSYLETPRKRIEKVDDLAGLGRTHPGTALLMIVFLFSLIGMPLTAGFNGKLLLFFEAMGLTGTEQAASEPVKKHLLEQVRLYHVLAVIAAVNAAIGAWYYLRVAAVMYLRDAVEPLPAPRTTSWPALACCWVCALLTLGLGVYPAPLVRAIKSSIPRRAEVRTAGLPPEALARQGPGERGAAEGVRETEYEFSTRRAE
jgi:NADH-quinone oxidoreductase subunit N